MLDSLTELDSKLEESSGLIYLDGQLISHNDSGGETRLYELDTLSGNITRTVFIENTNHVDWEDMCKDDTFIYIGDFGNNNGTRQNLRIYKIPITDYKSKDTVQAESISFSYADQTNFNSNRFQTNFDAEALISYEDSLYIFTKNWGNSRTNIYPVSKTPGTYSLQKTDSIDSQGLITGASFNQHVGVIYLCGYTFSEAFVLEIKQWPARSFSQGLFSKNNLAIQGSFQVEGITESSQNTYFLTAEGNASAAANLYRLSLESANGINFYQGPEIKLFPNPTTGYIIIETKHAIESCLFSSTGEVILISQEKKLNLSHLAPGLYFVKIFIPSINQYELKKIRIE